MYVKKCPKCKGKSYGSGRNNWICPYCGKDLNNVEAEIAEN